MELFNLWQDWLWFAAASLGLATFLSSVIYMLSELLQNEKMKTWAKMELTEVVYSAIIISLAVVSLPLVDSVVQGAIIGTTASGGGVGCAGKITTWWIPVTEKGTFAASAGASGPNVGAPVCEDICGDAIAYHPKSVYHGVESCHLRLGIWYLREIFDEAKNFAFDVYLVYIKDSMIAEFTINIEFLFEKAGFFTFTPWKGFFVMGNKIRELVFDWAIKLMMLTKFQEVLLKFIAQALFPALFIIGVLLRTFTFTRRLGGLLLAMAIALYFIFPAFYAFGALIMLNIKSNNDVQWAWRNSEANPCVGNPLYSLAYCPDPPIANSMYITNMTIYMPGGGMTGYNASDVRNRMMAYEGLDSVAYYGQMEQAVDGSGGALLPMVDPNTGRAVDLSSERRDTEAQQNASIARARQETENWFGSVSRRSMLDKFVSFAWEKNGPLETLGRLTFWSVFFSLFSIIGTIAAIRSLSITFGGDIEIAGLTRLI